MTRAQSLIAVVALCIVAALGGAWLARSVLQNRMAPSLVSGTWIEPAKAVPPFALVDQSNAPFAPEQLRGRWSFLFFGFTSCGDVCPTTLTLLASVTKPLIDSPETSRAQVVFVSVDAQRDSPRVVKEYLRHFNPNFIGVTGAQANLEAFAHSLGVPSAIRTLEHGYAVDHSAAILAINPNGGLQAIFSPPHTADALTRDFRTLIQQ